VRRLVQTTNGARWQSDRNRFRFPVVHGHTVDQWYTIVNKKFLEKKSEMHYPSAVSKTKPIPVRLSDEIIARLDAAAQQSGLENRTDVIKLLINSWLKHFEREGESALPPDWHAILQSLDHRTILAQANAVHRAGTTYQTRSRRKRNYQRKGNQ
jgi:hypothetical protein